ncbi:class I SAM-dependent methyltransferase [Haloarchaeobius sp. DFWS5]|uniref:class I SAM-dependent methyltransferase n=1 Tax=Haloarchaeobius sp. DFWS5 TaxID=3446114 RepID=UPI003EBF3E81
MDDAQQKRRNVDSFSAVADQYLDSAVHREGRDLALLASWSDDAERALDVACGAGHVAGALADSGVAEVVAVDVTAEMVRTARAAFAVPGVTGDAERLPFRDDSFDVVTCRIAAHHFPDPAAFVAEVARVLAPGGVFALEDNVAPEDAALADYFNRVEGHRDESHGHAYPVSWWRETLTAAGFSVEEAVTMRKELDYESWRDRTTQTADQRTAIDDLVRRSESRDVYGVTIEDDEITSFSNEKGLFRARLPAR